MSSCFLPLPVVMLMIIFTTVCWLSHHADAFRHHSTVAFVRPSSKSSSSSSTSSSISLNSNQRSIKYSLPTIRTTSSASRLYSKCGPMSCRLIGIGSATPATILTNSDLESVIDTTDEWIQSRTGISKRHVLQHTEQLRDLSVQASQRALEMANCSPQDLDMVICGTSSPDDLFGDAPSIAAKLGCDSNTLAFDLTAACSGFLFSTVTAGKFLSAPGSKTKKVLVLGADALSRWVDWTDRNTCILFGDGAGAMVLESTDSDADAGIMGFSTHSNGHGYGDLNTPMTGTENHLNTPGEGVTLTTGGFKHLTMNGKEVYKFATREVPVALEEALHEAGITANDVDWLLLHQANIRIMEVVANRLGIPMEKVITNLARYGNTSAASIPLALDEAVRSGKVKKGDVIACAGFGAGLSWGACIFKWG